MKRRRVFYAIAIVLSVFQKQLIITNESQESIDSIVIQLYLESLTSHIK